MFENDHIIKSCSTRWFFTYFYLGWQLNLIHDYVLISLEMVCMYDVTISQYLLLCVHSRLGWYVVVMHRNVHIFCSHKLHHIGLRPMVYNDTSWGRLPYNGICTYQIKYDRKYLQSRIYLSIGSFITCMLVHCIHYFVEPKYYILSYSCLWVGYILLSFWGASNK